MATSTRSVSVNGVEIDWNGDVEIEASVYDEFGGYSTTTRTLTLEELEHLVEEARAWQEANRPERP